MPEDHHHTTGAFSMSLPEGWRVTEEVESVALIAVAPDDDLGFHRNLVVTIEQLPDDLDADDWWQRARRAVTDLLTAARLLDVAEAELAGLPAQRLLVHHLADDHDVTLEQWIAPVGPYGWTVSTSVAALAYGRHADELRTTVATLRLHAPDGSRTDGEDQP